MKTTSQPLVSVIIPTFNREYCIERAVNSVRHQTYRNWELLIIDNSSNDKTRKVLLPYFCDPKIQYIHYKETINSSESLNCGIKSARGNYIALLDDDDEFMENKIEAQLSEMRTHKAEFSLSNCIKVYDGKKSAPEVYTKSLMLTKNDFFRAKIHLSHTHMMFKEEIKEECLFDPLLPASDDFDLVCRITGTHRILFVKEPLTYIHKSYKRKRISNNPQLRIKTFEELIKKVNTYNWTEENKQKAAKFFTLRLGFWLMMDKKYKIGRQTIREKVFYLPLAKRKKYVFVYFLSYCPPLFELLKRMAEHLWRFSAGRIKL